MISLQSELIILSLGILAALSSLQSFNEVRSKAWFLQILFALGIMTQIATHYVQYSNAVGNRKRMERTFAFSLFAYSRKDIPLLKRLSADNPYLIGYRLLQDSDFDGAAAYFREAIVRGSFEAPSHYLLAHMLRMKSVDWTEAKKHIDAAIAHDGEYAAAYYTRAIMEMQGNQHTRALEDLEQAVKYDSGQCYDITNDQEVDKLWSAIADKPTFQRLQKECRAKYDIHTEQAVVVEYGP